MDDKEKGSQKVRSDCFQCLEVPRKRLKVDNGYDRTKAIVAFPQSTFLQCLGEERQMSVKERENGTGGSRHCVYKIFQESDQEESLGNQEEKQKGMFDEGVFVLSMFVRQTAKICPQVGWGFLL